MKIKKNDIKLIGKKVYNTYKEFPRWVVYKGEKCKVSNTHCRRIYVCKKYGLVFKIGHSQSVTEFKNYKIICKKYKKLKKYFVPTYGCFNINGYSVGIQKYVKLDKKLNKKALTLLHKISTTIVDGFVDIGYDEINKYSYNCGLDRETRQLQIFDLGIEAIN
jgi:hypothetical protein